MEKVRTEVIELTDNSKFPNDSQKLWKSLEKPGVKENSTDKNKKQEMQDADSELPEHSQKSRTVSAVKTFEIKSEEKPKEKQTLLSGSKSREDSQKSRMNPCIKITEHEDL